MQRTCDCLSSGAQAVAPVMKNDSIPFDVLLDVSCNVKTHWPRILACENCCASEHTPATLTQTAMRLLEFYEAALGSYSHQFGGEVQRVMSSPLQLSSPRSKTSEFHVRSSNWASTRSDMTLGKLALDGEESLMLAQLLFSDYLAFLHDILEQLSALTEEMMHRNPTNRLISCESLLCQTMDKIASLTGQISFNTRKRKRACSPQSNGAVKSVY